MSALRVRPLGVAMVRWGARSARKTILVCSLVALTSLSATSSWAASDDPFDISSAPGLLPADAALGTVAATEGATERYAGTGPCVDADHPDGYANAAVYELPSSVRRLLELSVSDDLDSSPSLCRVSLYGAALTDPFDEEQRSALELASTTACATASACRLERWLGSDRTYFVVFWSAPQPDRPGNREPDDSVFEYSAKVRREIGISLSVTGHRIKDVCYGYHEVVRGRSFSVKANTSPNATGIVRFFWYVKQDDGRWSLYRTYDRTLSSGNAVFTATAGSSGKRRIRARFLGNATMLPETSDYRYVMYVAPRWTRYADGGARLWVKHYRQQHRLSCEAASLRMGHNYFHPGRIDYDMSVYKITGIDKRRPAVKGGCNPDRAFCGNVDGIMMRDGYGVHYRPIARAATHYDGCRPGLAISPSGFSFSAIARHLNNGYPVIVWGAHKGRSGIYRYTWRSWDGHYVVAWSVEHTWTVIGFHGPPSSPTSFIIHNPSGSGNVTVSRAAMWRFVKYFETAVVVRG